MNVGKPFLKVIKNAFGVTTREARQFLTWCKEEPNMAKGLAGEYNKMWVYTSVMNARK